MVRLRSREILPTKPIPLTHSNSPQPLTPAQTKESSLHNPSPSPISPSIRRKSQRLVLKSDSINGFYLDDRKEESLMGSSEKKAYPIDSERIMETPRIGSSRSGFDLNVGNEEFLNENGAIVSERETPIANSTERMSRHLGLESNSGHRFDLNVGNEDSLNENGVTVSEKEAPIADSTERMSRHLGLESNSGFGFDLNVGNEESLNENGVNVSEEETPIANSKERMKQHLGLELNSGNGFDLNKGNGKNALDVEIDKEIDTPIGGSSRRRSARLGPKSDSVDELGLDEGKRSLVENGVKMFDAERESDHGGSTGLSLRSGKRVLERTAGNRNGRDKRVKGSGSKRKEAVDKVKEDDGAVMDGLIDDGGDEKMGEDGDGVEKIKGKEIEESDRGNSWGRRLRRREEKGKVVDNDDNADNVLLAMHETELKDEMVKNQVGNDGSSSRGRKRYHSEEKGKAKLEGDDASADRLKMKLESTLMELQSKMKDLVVKSAGDKTPLQIENLRGNVTPIGYESRKDQFRKTAKENAPKFAHFKGPVEELPDGDVETPIVEVEEKVEDWPGPFSTAMKIIKDREKKLNSSHGTSDSEKAKRAPITWIPKNNKVSGRPKKLVPSLQELSIRILAKNVDNITSLECVPDTLRQRLCQLLCNSRSMNLHFFNLLVSDSPTEIRIKDCSWLTDEDFEKCFGRCDTRNLEVLQLDQCGRCMPDYVLSSSLARSPNSLPTLTTLSLSGGCRISDVGLSSIVSSAPALKSLNISRCSLLSSDSIGILANSLGSVLQELYIDDCQNIDPMAILPALKRLQQLQVLSVAGIVKVSDSFVKEFLVARGHNMKELILSDCVKLTDSSVKVIAETCPGLCTLDLKNLRRLTDSALGYLANGCREIQILRLCRISFSDEAIAAFLESSGGHLTDLSLNNVRKVDHITALSIAKCSKMLRSLDLSWCRNLTDEALGLIVDCCLSLKVLKLFGCGQITNVFLDGHSNPEVQIIGVKMSPLLDVRPQPSDYPLHYS